MPLGTKLQVRLSESQYQAVQQIAVYLKTDVSSVIRAAIDDAVETLNRWTGLEIEFEEKDEEKDKDR